MNKRAFEIYLKFENTLASEDMMSGASSVLVGFSGGADSTALLDMFSYYCKLEGKKLYALHVNHMIRGDEAKRDENFCREFCEKRGISFKAVSADIPSLARELKKGLEETARDERYRIFSEFAEKNGVDRIATAHNADDNLETVIFNLTRGTGIQGLGGILPKRENIIRPLIYITKAEISEYCLERGLSFVTDSTNLESDYTRNFIRHEIVPSLIKINPSVIKTVSESSKSLREDAEALNIISSAGYQFGDNTPSAVIKRRFRDRYLSHAPKGSLLTEHYNDFIRLYKKSLEGKANGLSLSLPCKVKVTFTGKGEYEFSDDKRERKLPMKKGTRIFPLFVGKNIIDELGMAVIIEKIGENGKTEENPEEIAENHQILKNVYKLSMNVNICFDTIDGISALYCRKRQEGDFYRFGNMTRKVKKLLSEKRIRAVLSEQERSEYPVVCDGEGILFLPGFKPRDGADISQSKNNHTFKITVLYGKKS